MRVRLPGTDIWICDSRLCDPDARLALPAKTWEVRSHLNRFMTDAPSTLAFRTAALGRAVRVGQRSNSDVSRILTHLLTSGALHFCRWDGNAYGRTTPANDTPPASAPVVRRPATPAPGGPAAPEDTFSNNLDVQSMVSTLEGAAEDGVPFCEECERLAQARAVQPAPEPEEETLPSDTDAELMAKNLENAAERGIPFCEVCARKAIERAVEQARQAAAAAGEDTFPPNLDVEAMVKSLERAAKDGKPFCVQCAIRAAMERSDT